MKKETDTLTRCFKYIVILLIGWWLINNFTVIGNLFSGITSIVLPFIIGGAIAFIINIPMGFFEKKLSKIKNKKLLRAISIILSIIIVVLILYLIINLIVPELMSIINLLINNIPYYIEEIGNFATRWNLTDYLKNIELNADNIKNQLLQIIPSLFTSSISIVGSVFGAISNTIIAIIFAIYVLAGKEKIGNALKNILYTYLKEKKVNKIIDVSKLTSDTFKSFFTVQCIEAVILGVLCAIGMLILKIPYAIPISVLIGVTALIPIVGAFIGIIVGAILIVAVAPSKVLTFVIFVLILQQFEGNVIYPRVVGESVGLPGMLVLVAVTIGGNIFGVLGMLLSVPIASVLYTLIKKDIAARNAMKVANKKKSLAITNKEERKVK